MDDILRNQLEQYRTQVIEGLSQQTASLGQLYDVGSRLDTIGAGIARLTAMTDWALPTIIGLLAQSAERLAGIEQMLASPNETAAAEYYRRGAFALANGHEAVSSTQALRWYDRAATDLRTGVTMHRYHPRPWLYLGIALACQGATEQAAEAFSDCAFFALVESEVLAATAVLLSANFYRQADRPDMSVAVLHDYLPQLDRCAEIHLVLAVHHKEPEHLRRALEIWPYLAIDAEAAGIAETETIAADIAHSIDGPITRLLRLERAMSAVQTMINPARPFSIITIDPAPQPVQLPSDSIGSLLGAVSALPVTEQAARRLVEQLAKGPGAVHAAIERVRVQGDSRVAAAESAISRRDLAVAAEVANAQLRMGSLVTDAMSESNRAHNSWEGRLPSRQVELKAIEAEELFRSQRIEPFLEQLPQDRPWVRFAAELVNLERQAERSKYRDPAYHRLGSDRTSAGEKEAEALRQHKLQEAHLLQRMETYREQEHRDAVAAVPIARAQAASALAEIREAAGPVLQLLEQITSAPSDPLRELEAAIAAIPQPIRRIIPFELPGYL